ncbi:MAG TPA: YcdB/YcdC domain-containing protein, partial [Anaerovoracaceae bacterium]|nr:YcdB/YcdC domain-containing protein [Anaerovoracaceae bacterium]
MKKTLILTLILCLTITMTIPVAAPVYAGKGEGNELEKAILSAKKVISVPGEYTEFSYHSHDYETNWGKGTVWNLNWADKDYESILYVSIDWEGNLLNYEHSRKSDDKGLAKVGRKEAAVISMDFLKKALPGFQLDLREVNEKISIANNYQHVFQYKYFQSDIPLNFINIHAVVNKYTGIVESFKGVEAGFKLPKLPANTALISAEEAGNIFLKETGFDLIYKSHFSFRNNELTVFSACKIAQPEKAVDATTGKVVSLYGGGYGPFLYGYAKEGSAGNDMGSQNLTKEELDAIENLGNLLSKKEAVAVLNSVMSLNLSEQDLKGSTLMKDYMEKDKYLWQLNFEDSYCTVDARTGELLGYDFYGDSREGKRNLTEDAAMKIAEHFLTSVSSAKFSECIYKPEGKEYEIFSKEKAPQSYTFQYNRLVDGIEFVDNGLTVTVNRNTGEITHYNNKWFDGLIFHPLGEAYTEQDFFKKLSETINFDKSYDLVGGKGEVAIVYAFPETARFSLFNPATGNRMNEDGSDYKYANRPEYQDMGNHWSKNIVEELLENGYYIKSDVFKPDANITQADFFSYLFAPEVEYYKDEEAFYRMLRNREIIKVGEEKPETEISRQDAAKFLIRYLGLGLAGEYPEVYVSKFKDKITEQYKGYAVLCYGLGIMKGDHSGRFNGTNIMTNAEAAVSIYNTI